MPKSSGEVQDLPSAYYLELRCTLGMTRKSGRWDMSGRQEGEAGLRMVTRSALGCQGNSFFMKNCFICVYKMEGVPQET